MHPAFEKLESIAPSLGWYVRPVHVFSATGETGRMTSPLFYRADWWNAGASCKMSHSGHLELAISVCQESRPASSSLMFGGGLLLAGFTVSSYRAFKSPLSVDEWIDRCIQEMNWTINRFSKMHKERTRCLCGLMVPDCLDHCYSCARLRRYEMEEWA